VSTIDLGEIGRCIDCGRVDIPLSGEHIVRLALGGRRVLQKASCAQCAAKDKPSREDPPSDEVCSSEWRKPQPNADGSSCIPLIVQRLEGNQRE
jgi:hypothetical protein